MTTNEFHKLKFEDSQQQWKFKYTNAPAVVIIYID